MGKLTNIKLNSNLLFFSTVLVSTFARNLIQYDKFILSNLLSFLGELVAHYVTLFIILAITFWILDTFFSKDNIIKQIIDDTNRLVITGCSSIIALSFVVMVIKLIGGNFSDSISE